MKAADAYMPCDDLPGVEIPVMANTLPEVRVPGRARQELLTGIEQHDHPLSQGLPGGGTFEIKGPVPKYLIPVYRALAVLLEDLEERT